MRHAANDSPPPHILTLSTFILTSAPWLFHANRKLNVAVCHRERGKRRKMLIRWIDHAVDVDTDVNKSESCHFTQIGFQMKNEVIFSVLIYEIKRQKFPWKWTPMFGRINFRADTESVEVVQLRPDNNEMNKTDRWWNTHGCQTIWTMYDSLTMCSGVNGSLAAYTPRRRRRRRRCRGNSTSLQKKWKRKIVNNWLNAKC